MKRTITIEGMSCNHCVMRVRSALMSIPGVTRVEVSLQDGIATIEASEPITDAQLRQAVEEAGYKVTSIE
ncbi:heavy-metal-associated domain-containing protein [Coprothermobacteraceae bacterium]|nr:heavy-metal-associated domain-containing protein [Coprothermobacteraceae bacterium]